MSSYFEKLDVWKKSCRLSVELYNSLKECRDYGFKDQMLRAAISVPSNIAEGSERNSIPDYKRFLAIARGSAAELRTQLYIASEIGLIHSNQVKTFITEIKSISKMLQALDSSLTNSQNKSSPETGTRKPETKQGV